MSSETVYIISLKFAPGLKKEFMVFGENIRKKGVNVKYILSNRYVKLEEECVEAEYIPTANCVRGMIIDTFKFINGKKFAEIFYKYPPVLLYFYNPHPLNPFIARLAKRKFPKAITTLYLHEPYKPDKTSYGILKSSYIKLVELIQKVTVKYMDHIFFPSEHSLQLFKKYYSYKRKTHIAPLLVPDQRVLNDKKKLKYFSIVGNVNNATGHDTFIELVNYVGEKEMDFEFILITSSNISKILKKLSNKALKKINLINKEIINDSEINAVIRESYAIFRLDKEVTQSGVIPVAYMNERPVIVRDIYGLTQHVKHKQNGFIVPFNCKPEDLILAMNFVRKNFVELSKNARKSYEEKWSDRNWDKYYKWLLSGIVIKCR